MEKNWKPQYDIICEFRQTIYSLQFSIWLLSYCCLKITETKIELGLGKPTTKLIIPLYNLQWHLRIQYFKTLCGMSAMPCTFNDAPTEIPQQFTNNNRCSKIFIWCFLGNHWGHFHLYFSSTTRSPKGQNMRYHRWENFSDWMGAKIKDALASGRTTFLIWMLILQH